MINEIICIGTSFTWGDSIDINRNSDIITWYKETLKIDVSRETHSFPSLLENLTNIKTRNLGKCGASLQYLIRNVEDIIETEDVSDKVFILEYSNWGRAELWSNKYNDYLIGNWGPRDGHDASNEGWASYLTLDYGKEYPNTTEVSWSLDTEMKTYDVYLDNFHDEKNFLITIDRIFLNLLYKLQFKNIKFVILPLENLFWEGLKTNIIFDNIIDSFRSKTEDNMGLYGFVAQEKLRIMDLSDGLFNDGHPSIYGYEKIANKIFNNLKQKNIL